MTTPFASAADIPFAAYIPIGKSRLCALLSRVSPAPARRRRRLLGWISLLCGLASLIVSAPATAQDPEPTQAPDRRLVSTPFHWFDLAEHLSAEVSLGDLDGDGDLDVALANGRHWAEPNFVFFNLGNAKLPSATPLGSTLRTSYALLLADLDGDGALDAVGIHDYLAPTVWLGDGGGHFVAGPPITTGAGRARGGVIADLTGDGILDLVVARRREPDVLYVGQGDAQFARARPFGAPEGSSTAVAAADWDADGDLDLVFARRDGQPSVVAWNDGTGALVEQALPDSIADARRVVAADVDGDGRLDLVLGIVGAANRVYRGNGAGEFTRAAAFGNPDGRTYALAAADLDLDGDLDFIEGNDEQPNAVYFNLGNGAGTDPTFERVVLGDDARETYGVAVGDLDGDRYPDVVFANSGGVNVVYVNRPSMP